MHFHASAKRVGEKKWKGGICVDAHLLTVSGLWREYQLAEYFRDVNSPSAQKSRSTRGLCEGLNFFVPRGQGREVPAEIWMRTARIFHLVCGFRHVSFPATLQRRLLFDLNNWFPSFHCCYCLFSLHVGWVWERVPLEEWGSTASFLWAVWELKVIITDWILEMNWPSIRLPLPFFFLFNLLNFLPGKLFFMQ